MLDRDGTLIERIPYLSAASKVQLLPTVPEAIELLLAAGLRLFLHSNQSGVARGYFSEEDAWACNDAMLRQLGRGPELFERVCMAFEGPENAGGYRKPSPRFGWEIMKAYGLDAVELCYIGDNVSDMQTARAVGCNGIGVQTGGLALADDMRADDILRAWPVYGSLVEAARYVAGT